MRQLALDLPTLCVKRERNYHTKNKLKQRPSSSSLDMHEQINNKNTKRKVSVTLSDHK